MKRDQNLKHWNEWASTFGTDLNATTKCKSIKTLEIAALGARIEEAILREDNARLKVLEVGCGNGLNGVALCDRFPDIEWIGCDYSQEMIKQAHVNFGKTDASLRNRMQAFVADALNLEKEPACSGTLFDIVYTDRCIINLAGPEEQIKACKQIAGLLKPGGLYLMLENSKQTHLRLNELRQSLGLPFRPVAEYNIFIDEPQVIGSLLDTFDLEGIDDFGSLHDILLYVLKPALHPELEVVYDDDLMAVATRLSVAHAKGNDAPFGTFGQNRLWRLRKRS